MTRQEWYEDAVQASTDAGEWVTPSRNGVDAVLDRVAALIAALPNAESHNTERGRYEQAKADMLAALGLEAPRDATERLARVRLLVPRDPFAPASIALVAPDGTVEGGWAPHMLTRAIEVAWRRWGSRVVVERVEVE